MKGRVSLIIFLCAILCITLLPATVFAAIIVYEGESNNDFSRANRVEPGSTIQGVVSDSNDADYYKITAPDNGKISLSFLHTLKADSDQWRVTLFLDESGTTTLFDDYIALNDSKKMELPYIGATKGKSYYIRVSNRAYSYGVIGENYQIQTKFEKSNYFERELNDDFPSATILKAGNNVSGIISDDNDTDYYKITAPDNGKISLSFLHTLKADSDQWRVTLFLDESGTTTLFDYYIALNDSKKMELPYIGATKGKSYYIRVSNRAYSYGVIGENYQIQTKFEKSNYYEKELNDDFPTATAVEASSSVQGNIADSYDEDYYKVKAPASGIISFSFSHKVKSNSDQWRITAFSDKSGTKTLFDYYIALNDRKTVELPSIKVTKGKSYYIRVSNRAYSYGVIGENYVLEVKYPVGTSIIRAAGLKNAISLKWNTVASVTGYEIQYCSNKNFKSGVKKVLVKNAKISTKKITRLSKNKNYYVRIRTYKTVGKKTYYSNWSKTTKVKTK